MPVVRTKFLLESQAERRKSRSLPHRSQMYSESFVIRSRTVCTQRALVGGGEGAVFADIFIYCRRRAGETKKNSSANTFLTSL